MSDERSPSSTLPAELLVSATIGVELQRIWTAMSRKPSRDVYDVQPWAAVETQLRTAGLLEQDGEAVLRDEKTDGGVADGQ